MHQSRASGRLLNFMGSFGPADDEMVADAAHGEHGHRHPPGPNPLRPLRRPTLSGPQAAARSGKEEERWRPPGRRLIANRDNPAVALEISDAHDKARKLGIDVTITDIARIEDIAPAIDALKGHAEFLYVVSDPFANANRVRINTFALAARIPTMHAERGYIETGGLISYGANYPDLFRRAGEYVDKIMRGAKPGDIPVEQPTKFDLVINMTTAKALGLEVPASLLARADEVIE